MAPKLKILHFMWSANFGGIEKLVIDLCQTQNSTSDIQSEILIGCAKGSFMQNLVDNNIPHFYGNLKSGFDFSPAKYRLVKSKMKEYDIIHIHTFNLIVIKAAIDSGKKIIYTIHGNFNLGRKPKLGDHFNTFFLKYFLNSKIDYLTFNSEFTKKIATERYQLKIKNQCVIYNGIPLRKPEDIMPIDNTDLLNQLKNKFVIGTTSRFNAFKRIDRLIDAFAIFSKGKPDTILLLVGDGVVKQELEKQVDEKNLRASTIFAGYQKNVQGFQKLMDVCVFPSQNEPFGLVAVETLSMGKPTLMFTDAGGMLEILTNEFKSDIVTDVSNLAERLDYYYFTKNHQNLELLAKRQQLAAGFDVKIMERSFYEAYLKIVR